ncbi:MAG: hypothetical protein P0S96_03505 [Simkaniaceae bacterium]|nr:hypothetical protein [Candidatus Sacchlamyda saccharinae]
MLQETTLTIVFKTDQTRFGTKHNHLDAQDPHPSFGAADEIESLEDPALFDARAASDVEEPPKRDGSPTDLISICYSFKFVALPYFGNALL